MIDEITLSVLKADVGSLVGHHIVHPKILEVARKKLHKAKSRNIILDYYVCNCGDDLELIMTHKLGEENTEIHKTAWGIFYETTKVAKKLKLYAPGQDLLANTFSGNIKGMGPGYAEMEIQERSSEPIIIFMIDKADSGAFNLPFYKTFADPFCTSGLVINPKMSAGFKFEVHDIYEDKKVLLEAPREIHDILALIGTTSRYIIKRVFTKNNDPCAVVSSVKLRKISGKYVGKDDPAAIVRAQYSFPAVGEILEPFAFPYLVAGWMRGSHNCPIMPVGLKDAKCTRFDGPSRVVALGFQITNGTLIGPADLFDDVAFNRARTISNQIADYMRQHGPFMPARVSEKEMEYTTINKVLKKLKDRFKQI